MVTPVFLVAARRSGTTLFRLMLNGHPSIIFQHKWESVADAIAGFAADPSEPQTVKVDDCESFTVIGRDVLKRQLDENIAQLLAEQNKTVFGATCHIGFVALPKMWDSAKFIHLIRDPRDIAISHKKLGWAGHYYFAGDAWIEAEQDWDSLSAMLAPKQYLEIRYEDLISRPEHELSRVCKFLEINYTDALFNYVKDGKYSYPKKEFMFRWKGRLSDNEVQLVESRMHPIMKMRGYVPDSVRKNYSVMHMAGFRLHNVWNKRMKRIRDLGLSHVLMDKLARVLNWKSLTRHHEKAIAEKRAQHIAGLEENY